MVCKSHDITLIAFTRDGAGLYSILDVVETSFRNASFFARRWYRDHEVVEMAAVKPGTLPGNWLLFSRFIYRAATIQETETLRKNELQK